MRLNKFLLNSDYTAEKQKLDFTLSLPSATVSVGGGQSSDRTVDFTVPSGVYFENVNISTSLTGNNSFVGNFLEYEPADMMSTISFSVGQLNPTTYRLTARIMNWDSSSHNFTFSANAKVHLSIAPF